MTGGSRGIGAAIVQRLLDGGATVVTTARTPTDETPKAATFIQGDISTLGGVQTFTAAALSDLGGLDILVNNAAQQALISGDPPPSPPRSGLTRSTSTSCPPCVRPTLSCRPCRPCGRSGPGGAIVNLSSAASLTPQPPLAHYGAAKAALSAYSKALASELAPAGIRVATVVPGNVITPGGDAVRQAFADAAGAPLEAITAGIPLGRPGDPRDIAYLVSDRAQWVTGDSLTIDGGELPLV